MDRPTARYLSVKQFAATRGLSTKTVRRFIKLGTVKAEQYGGPGGKIVIPVDEHNRPLQDIQL